MAAEAWAATWTEDHRWRALDESARQCIDKDPPKHGLTALLGLSHDSPLAAASSRPRYLEFSGVMAATSVAGSQPWRLVPGTSM